MDELEKLQQLHQDDYIAFRSKALDSQIVYFTKLLNSLRDTKNFLSDSLEQAENRLNILEEENEKLKQILPQDVDSEVLNVSGDFFTQLRSIEQAQEKLHNKITGNSDVNRRLSDDIKAFTARTNVLMKEQEQLKEKLQSIHSKLINEESKLKSSNSKITKYQLEFAKSHDETNQIVSEIHLASNQNSDFTLSDLENLKIEKEELARTLKDHQEQLELLIKKEKNLEISSKAKETLRKKTSANFESSSQWMSLRTSLVGKIKKARLELQALENQATPTSSRLSSRSHVRSSLGGKRPINNSHSPNSPLHTIENNFTEEEAKAAIASEIEYLKGKGTQFFDNTIATETEYQEQLKKQLETLDNLSKQIRQFKDSVDKLDKEHENQASKSVHINLLKAELAEIRKDL